MVLDFVLANVLSQFIDGLPAYVPRGSRKGQGQQDSLWLGCDSLDPAWITWSLCECDDLSLCECGDLVRV